MKKGDLGWTGREKHKVYNEFMHKVFFTSLLKAQDKFKERRQLARLDTHRLDDMGIDPFHRVAHKTFWRSRPRPPRPVVNFRAE